MRSHPLYPARRLSALLWPERSRDLPAHPRGSSAIFLGRMEQNLECGERFDHTHALPGSEGSAFCAGSAKRRLDEAGRNKPDRPVGVEELAGVPRMTRPYPRPRAS